MSAEAASHPLHDAATPTTPAEETTKEWLDTAVEAMGGTDRLGQQAMAVQVARALESNRHLLVQAGTGTGKSLAYLVPALYHAQRSDKPIIIATATLALQSQIMGRDAPNTIEALDDTLGNQRHVALLKGRANYVCKLKLDGGFADDSTPPLIDADPAGATSNAPSDLGNQVLRVRQWAEETDTGDRDELKPGVNDAAWRQVSVTARECVGASKCPLAEECFSELARKQAAEADIVVTNHAMLAIDAFEDINVLPEYDAVIIDEAHEFADRVTSAVTAQLSGSMARSVASSVRRETGVSTSEITTAANNLDETLIPTKDGWLHRGFTPEQIVALETLRDATRTAQSDLKSATDSGSKDGDTDTGTHLSRTRLQELLDVTQRMLDTQDSNGHLVVWATRPGHFEPGKGYIPGDPEEPPRLYCAPLSVATRLRDNLLDQATTILTSATLALGGSFDTVAGDLGLMGREKAQFKAIDVGSPFNYPKQGIIYLAKHLPPPSMQASEQMLDELEKLLRASGGGALCLFSSKRAATDVAEQMRNRPGRKFPILVQGESSLAGLIDEFSQDRDASLFGTMSLWQGVDVPGDALRLVTIDRIPFARPDDPLAAARTRKIKEAGGNGFMAVSVTHAAMRMAQGVGRLIRRTDDRGVVAILDSRIATARYSGFIRDSVPKMWATYDLETACGALERISG